MSLGKSLSGIAVELGIIKGQTLKTGNGSESEKNEYRMDRLKVWSFGKKKHAYNLILAATAVGFSILYNEGQLLDGKNHVTNAEEADIDQYIKKLQERASNRKLVKKILDMKKDQIDFVGALNYVAKIPSEDWGVFEKFLNIISESGDSFSDGKIDFVKNILSLESES